MRLGQARLQALVCGPLDGPMLLLTGRRKPSDPGHADLSLSSGFAELVFVT